MSKKAILEVAMSNLQIWQGLAQSWGPCMPIWQFIILTLDFNLLVDTEITKCLSDYHQNFAKVNPLTLSQYSFVNKSYITITKT